MSNRTLALHPENPRCLLYLGKPFKILTSAEHYGAVLNADFDYDVYLTEMSRTGQNATRVFTFYREVEHSIPALGIENTLAPRPEASVMPWQRVAGHGKAADGLGKFDLDLWNGAYFDRLKDYVEKCAASGVVCEIVLFCNPYSQDTYDLFPCSRISNVNGVGGDLEAPSDFMTLDTPSIVAFQERLVRKVVTELNRYDNVYYEICNEPNIRGEQAEENERRVVGWHAHLARVIRETEANLRKKHLIAANASFIVTVSDEGDPLVRRHEDRSYFENPDVDIVNYHYISEKKAAGGLQFRGPKNAGDRAGLIWHFLSQRDAYPKPIVFDETFSGIVRGESERYGVNRAEAWEMILSGGAGYSNLDWSFTPSDEAGSGRAPIADGRLLDGRPLREWIGILHKLLAHYDLGALSPATGVLPDDIPGYGYAASADGSGRYILYFVDKALHRLNACEARSLNVALTLPPGRYAVRTLDPKSGDTSDPFDVDSDGTAALEVPSFADDVAVLVAKLA